MAIKITMRLLLIAVIALAALLILGPVLGLGVFFIGAALVLRMSQKWKVALLVVGALLFVVVLFGRLF